MEEEEEKSRCKQQDVHLHRHSQAEWEAVLPLRPPPQVPRQPPPCGRARSRTQHVVESSPCPAPRPSPEEEAAPGPALLQEEVDGEEEDGHGDGVVKEPQDKDGVDAVGGATHEEENIRGDLALNRETRGQSAACPGPPAAAEPLQTSDPQTPNPDLLPSPFALGEDQAEQERPRGSWRDPLAPGYLVCSAVDAEDEEEVEEVEAGKEVLCQADVGAAARGVVQAQEDVDEAGGVAVERRE